MRKIIRMEGYRWRKMEKGWDKRKKRNGERDEMASRI